MTNTTNDGLLEKVDALMAAERWTEAIASVEPMLAKLPSNHRLLWAAGWAHFQMEHYADAASYLRKAIDAGPVDHAYFGALGMSFVKLEKYDDAELWLLRALAIRDSSLTRSGLALAYQKQDMMEVAEAVHKEGLRLRPDHRERLEAYADFLSDAGRDEEAKTFYEHAGKLPCN